MNGQVGANLMILLSADWIMYYSEWALAVQEKETRQIVDHKHVLVNGKIA